jgi:hypothetical protein
MRHFITRHADQIVGVLNGWDRLRLRGTLRWLANVDGMKNYLWHARVLLKDFKRYALGITGRIKQATERLAHAAGRPVKYLASSAFNKEAQAQRIALENGVTEGLICVLSCVELGWSYEVGPNRERKELELRGGQRKCLHYYFYLIDRRLGWMHMRLQTWFPFTLHLCVNGREWLARQLDGAGIAYRRRDNCFVDVADWARAQRVLDRQLTNDWPKLLAGLVRRFHPAHRQTFAELPTEYYWSADESEWASDVAFRSPSALAKLYPTLIRHGMESFSSREVMRFLGRKVPVHGGVHGRFLGEVQSDLVARPEGMRLKHRLGHNSIKMYNKQGSVLRVETTINDARDMKAYRAKEGPDGEIPKTRAWRRLRKGVADLPRRAEISQAANDRYLDGLAAAEATVPLGRLAGRICQPAWWQGRRVRALNPLSPDDAKLLQAICRGEFAINGFRNRDLRSLLFGPAGSDPAELRRQSGSVTRKLRLLRGHGLIKKAPKTHRYLLTAQGTLIVNALLAARNADAQTLTKVAG